MITWFSTRRALLVAACVGALVTACSSGGSSGSSSSPAVGASGSLSGSASGTAHGAISFDAADQATIDKLAQANLFNGITGLVVGIDDPVKGHMVKAYGAADVSGRPIATDMHYRIASVSKTFTAYEVLHLAEQGKLSLSDPVDKYVAGVPNGGSITIEMLLAMRSGLFDYTSDPTFAQQYDTSPTYPSFMASDVLKIVNANKNGTPDTVSSYCNTNYYLLGDVIMKVTGRALNQVMDSAAQSFRLSQTTFPTTDTLPAPYLDGYRLTNPAADGVSKVVNPKTVQATESNPLVPSTAGAMISTVPDMLRYAQQLGTGAQLSAATFQQRQAFVPLQGTNGLASYGLGLTKLGSWIGHDGSIIGYSDMVFYLPDRKVSLVVAANEADGDRVPSQALWGDIVKALYPGTLPGEK